MELAEGSNPNRSSDWPTRELVILATENGTATGAGIYKIGTSVVLGAIPELGFLFGGWGLDVDENEEPATVILDENPTTIILNENMIAVVIFQRDDRDLDGDGFTNYEEIILHETSPLDPSSYPTRNVFVQVVGEGTVSGRGRHRLFSFATITAHPAPGYIFEGWDGDVDEADPSVVIFMDSNKSLQARFVPDPLDGDSDGDGWRDEVEAAFGSLSADPLSVPQFQLRVSPKPGDEIEVMFPAAIDTTYTLQDSLDLVIWRNIEEGISGQNDVVTRSYSTAPQGKYFRVQRN
ncbi:MAG: hypothetical protein GY917_25335 [Planctomycetaceae bacterium]|nr:hypothetical protein [Planctomycetaceae bacterium]